MISQSTHIHLNHVKSLHLHALLLEWRVLWFLGFIRAEHCMWKGLLFKVAVERIKLLIDQHLMCQNLIMHAVKVPSNA